MVVNHQPNYSWIGLLIGFILVGTVIATFGFSHTEIVNPLASGAAATATISAVNYDGQSRQLGLNATATAIAVIAESDRLNAKIAPTRTAIADAGQQKRNDEDHSRDSGLFTTAVYVSLGVLTLAAVLTMLGILYHAAQSLRIKVTESKAKLLQQQIELAAAEAVRFERESVALKERRRNIEIRFNDPEAGSSRDQSAVQRSNNGHEPDHLRNAA